MAERTTSEVLARTRTQINQIKEDVNNTLAQWENKVVNSQYQLFTATQNPQSTSTLSWQKIESPFTSSSWTYVSKTFFPPGSVYPGWQIKLKPESVNTLGAIVISSTDSNWTKHQSITKTVAKTGSIYISKDNKITVKLSNIYGEGIDNNQKYLISQAPLGETEHVILPTGSNYTLDLSTNSATVAWPSGTFIIIPHSSADYDIEGGITVKLTVRHDTFYTIPSNAIYYSSNTISIYDGVFPTAPSGTFCLAGLTPAGVDDNGAIMPTMNITNSWTVPSDKKLFFVDARLKLEKQNSNDSEYVFAALAQKSFFNSTESSAWTIQFVGTDGGQEIDTELDLTILENGAIDAKLEFNSNYNKTETNSTRFNNSLFYKQPISLWVLMIQESTQNTE